MRTKAGRLLRYHAISGALASNVKWLDISSPDTVGPVNVYIVFYGAWSNLNAVSNINYLVANLGTSNW